MNLKRVIQYFKIRTSHMLFCMIVFITCSICGQVAPKRLLKEEDFNSWSMLRAPSISADGNWISYPIAFIEKADTLVVMNPIKRITYRVAGGSDGSFLPVHSPRWFVFNTESLGVGIMDLNNGSIKWYNSADYYQTLASSSMLVCVENREDKTEHITLINLDKDEQKFIENISDFALSPNGRYLAYSINSDYNSKVLIRDWDKIQYSYSSKSGKHFFHNIIWKPQSDAVSFMDRSTSLNLKTESESIVSWEIETENIEVLNTSETDILKGRKILSNLFYYSDDGNNLIFNVMPDSKEELEKQVTVQEWRGTDPWVYPKIQNDWHWINQWWKTVWSLEKKKALQIGNEQAPEVIIGPSQKYALVYSRVASQPQFTQVTVSDLYIFNIETGDKHLVVKNVNVSQLHIKISAEGRYISFFKDKQWWVHDIQIKTNTCLTQNLNNSFYSKSSAHGSATQPYGNPGWTKGDLEILIYDHHDLWAMTPDGKLKRRLTNGKENGITFRIDNSNIVKPLNNKGVFQSYKYDIKNHAFILSASKNEIPFAYYIIEEDFKLKLLVSSNKKITSFRKADLANSYVFSEESADTPPTLFYLRNPNDVLKKVYQSNPQNSDFLWGKTELVNFINSSGQDLKAILRYPDNFEEGKTYPMVVNIYEKKSQAISDFIIPTYFEDAGFNARIYTASGYFVLEPDITYVLGAPGFSAVDCVTSAVDAVLDKGNVDKNRIGIIGHSFGGYETAFIITQTNIFKAAVAGAAVTDLTSFYFSVNKDFQIPEMWRFEDQQWRMKNSFYYNKDAYNANSPIQQAENINTPLLLWTGENDGIIPATQSIEFYLALRRLRKDVLFLLYTGEDHALLLPKNQKDLSQRIKVWFDSYLK